MRHDKTKAKEALWTRRARRVRSKVFGTAEKPRLSVFRSNAHIGLQLIDDERARTLASAEDEEIATHTKKSKNAAASKNRKVEVARLVGKLIAEKAGKIGVARVAFDRGGYTYHGRVKAAAEGAREGGLKF